MDLLKGMEKFGLKSDEMKIYDDKDPNKLKASLGDETQQDKLPLEEEYLFEKHIVCPVCENKFSTYRVKSGKVKRLESDEDLRPRYRGVDTLKYDVTSCPKCGYTALNREFESITRAQRLLVEEQVVKNFKPLEEDTIMSLEYDEAIDRLKLALYNSIVKKGKSSEKAFICLKISWLMRTKVEALDTHNLEDQRLIKNIEQEELKFYNQGFEGFVRAIAEENYPMCGMDQEVMDYLIAAMALKLGKVEVASRFISGILSSRSASRRIKDKALTMKDKILLQLRQNK